MGETTENLVWCGPTGHHSVLCGDLEPGKRYAIPVEYVDGFLRQPEFWKRPATTKPIKAGKE